MLPSLASQVPSDRRAETGERQWRRFAATYLAVFFGCLSALFALLILVDPFDSGRSPFSIAAGVSDGDSRFARASNGRDPQFDAAIFGNSRGIALSPARLSAASGLAFVQMTVPGTTAREQLALMRWFIEHHPRIGALVLVADEVWCTQDPSLPTLRPFPLWLYGSWLDYLPHLVSRYAVDRAGRRIGLALGLTRRSDPAGFDADVVAVEHAFDPAAVRYAPLVPPPSAIAGALPFPAIDRFAAVIAALPDVPVVVLAPPAYYTALPIAGSPAALQASQCQAAFAQLLSRRRKGTFLDFQLADDMTRNPENFLDYVHYKVKFAQLIESRIAASLNN